MTVSARMMAVMWCAVVTIPASAQLTTPDNPSLTIGGYVRSLAGLRDLGYAVPVGDRQSVFNSEVVRIKWLANFGETFRLSVHNRVQATLSSTSFAGDEGVVGFGVSVVPDRTVNLEQILIDRDKMRVTHDIDRLSLTGYFDVADITVGRQAITWGVSNIFPIADLWAQFSPFELDVEEKPGLDAVRALLYPSSGIEMDVVVGDRGSWRDLSAGVRVTAELSVGDVYGAVAKFWRQFMTLAGASFVAGSWKIRSEMVVPWDIDRSEFGAVRATIGADLIGASMQFSGEYHFNGLGAASSQQYLERLESPALARGESYYIGRHYIGAATSYLATDRLTLTASALGNLQDPSLAAIPAFAYNMGQNARISGGALVSVGRRPVFGNVGISALRSEFGSYGHFAYGQFSLYF